MMSLIHSNTNSAIKKNEILPFATTQMGLEAIMLNEINQTQKHKYCYDFTYMRHLKNKSTKLIDTEQISRVQREEGGGR